MHSTILDRLMNTMMVMTWLKFPIHMHLKLIRRHQNVSQIIIYSHLKRMSKPYDMATLWPMQLRYFVIGDNKQSLNITSITDSTKAQPIMMR